MAGRVKKRARQRGEALASREALCQRVETIEGDDCLEQLAPMLVDPRDRALARIAGPLTTTDHHSRLIVRGQ